jgi:hypothetical protein
VTGADLQASHCSTYNVCTTTRRFIRTTNLLERLFVEERRRLEIIPNGFGEKPVLKLMFGALIRAAERWRGLRFTEFELARSPPSGRTQRRISVLNQHAAGPVVPTSCFQQICALTRLWERLPPNLRRHSRGCLQLRRERIGIGRRTFWVSDTRGIPESANV